MKKPHKLLVVCLVVLFGISLWLTRFDSQESTEISNLTSLTPLGFTESMTDMDSFDYDEDGNFVGGIHARQVVKLANLNILQMEGIRVESADLNVWADQGQWHIDIDTLILESAVKVLLEDKHGGSIDLRAEQMKIHTSKAGHYDFQATGNPASFQHKEGDLNDQAFKAIGKAQLIEYDEDSSSLILTGNAELENNGHYFGGDKLRYFIDEN